MAIDRPPRLAGLALIDKPPRGRDSMTVAERWFRTWPDSGELTAPRVLTRLLTPLDRLDDLITTYEELLGTAADLRMPIPDFGGLELSAINGLLLIASERPFTDMQRATRFSQIVPSLARAIAISTSAGAEVVEPPETIVPGSRARLRYPDGLLTELVEHRPFPGETPRPRLATTDNPTTQLLPYLRVHRADYDSTVRFYEQAFQAVATPVRDTAGSATRVGALLLTTTDGSADTDSASDTPRAALWCNNARAHLASEPDRSAQLHPPRPVLDLPGGLSAELWESAQT